MTYADHISFGHFFADQTRNIITAVNPLAERASAINLVFLKSEKCVPHSYCGLRQYSISSSGQSVLMFIRSCKSVVNLYVEVINYFGLLLLLEILSFSCLVHTAVYDYYNYGRMKSGHRVIMEDIFWISD